MHIAIVINNNIHYTVQHTMKNPCYYFSYHFTINLRIVNLLLLTKHFSTYKGSAFTHETYVYTYLLHFSSPVRLSPYLSGQTEYSPRKLNTTHGRSAFSLGLELDFSKFIDRMSSAGIP